MHYGNLQKIRDGKENLWNNTGYSKWIYTTRNLRENC